MFGKSFASMYSGSMFGKPAIVFAVWGYAISCQKQSRKDGQCYVEINPVLLAATFATSVEEIVGAIKVLMDPDPASRSRVEEGRRLVLVGGELEEGPMQFRVVNGAKYLAMRAEDERRVYLREAKRRERAKKPSQMEDILKQFSRV